jgi:hypothetical protein
MALSHQSRPLSPLCLWSLEEISSFFVRSIPCHSRTDDTIGYLSGLHKVWACGYTLATTPSPGNLILGCRETRRRTWESELRAALYYLINSSSILYQPMLFVADRLTDNKLTGRRRRRRRRAGHRRRAQHLKRTPPSPSDGSAPPAQDPEPGLQIHIRLQCSATEGILGLHTRFPVPGGPGQQPRRRRRRRRHQPQAIWHLWLAFVCLCFGLGHYSLIPFAFYSSTVLDLTMLVLCICRILWCVLDYKVSSLQWLRCLRYRLTVTVW